MGFCLYGNGRFINISNKNKLNKIVYILLFVCITASSQGITRKGYWNAHRGDSIGANRTTMAKAQSDCTMLGLTNYANEEIYITAPGKWVYNDSNLPFRIDGELDFISISSANITSTSAMILIELNSLVFDHIYVKFKRDIDTNWLETSKGNNNSPIVYANKLVPKSNYEYQVFASDNGVEISSMILTFQTP